MIYGVYTVAVVFVVVAVFFFLIIIYVTNGQKQHDIA